MIRRDLARWPYVLILVGMICSPWAKAESVLELFTSHGCYSCPPAEALFNELNQQDDSLIALEYHVDYWNTLVYGSAGSWVDPFSKPAYSERQRGYNLRDLQGRPGVYTPQAIINGRYAAVGSNRRQVTAALKKELPDEFLLEVKAEGDRYLISASTAHPESSHSESVANAKVWLVRFLKSTTTEITSGENKGKVLSNHHVVTSKDSLGSFPKNDSTQFIASVHSDPNMGCAVLVQDDFHSPILAAARCP